jgi:hypothetical protein
MTRKILQVLVKTLDENNQVVHWNETQIVSDSLQYRDSKGNVKFLTDDATPMAIKVKGPTTQSTTASESITIKKNEPDKKDSKKIKKSSQKTKKSSKKD